jgi:hypothetical protein
LQRQGPEQGTTREDRREEQGRESFILWLSITTFNRYADLARPPGLDVAVLACREDDVLVVVEAEGAHNLLAVAAGQTDGGGLVEDPTVRLWAAGEVDELEVLLAVGGLSAHPSPDKCSATAGM